MMSENKSIPQNLETEPFDRLKDEDLRALCQTEESIRQMSKYKDDYQVLQNTLKTLPDKYSYDILVPFGNKAFMPVIENQIQDIEKQKQLLKSRVENLSEAEGAFEIKEAYDEEEEKKWREQHRENVRRNYREERRKEKEVSEDDKDVWDLLDKLEQNEQEKEELLEEGGYLSKDEEESDDIGHNSITFKHTRLTEQQRREVAEANRRDVNTPADIYEKFACRQRMKDSRLNVRDQTERHCENKAFTHSIVERESSIVQEKGKETKRKVSKFRAERQLNKFS